MVSEDGTSISWLPRGDAVRARNGFGRNRHAYRTASRVGKKGPWGFDENSGAGDEFVPPRKSTRCARWRGKLARYDSQTLIGNFVARVIGAADPRPFIHVSTCAAGVDHLAPRICQRRDT